MTADISFVPVERFETLEGFETVVGFEIIDGIACPIDPQDGLDCDACQ